MENQSDPPSSPSLISYCGLVSNVHTHSLEHSNTLTHIPKHSDAVIPGGKYSAQGFPTLTGTPRNH